MRVVLKVGMAQVAKRSGERYQRDMPQQFIEPTQLVALSSNYAVLSVVKSKYAAATLNRAMGNASQSGMVPVSASGQRASHTAVFVNPQNTMPRGNSSCISPQSAAP